MARITTRVPTAKVFNTFFKDQLKSCQHLLSTFVYVCHYFYNKRVY